VDEKELKIIGNDPTYWWFKAKNEIIETYIDTTKEILNVGAGTTNFYYATNYNGFADCMPFADNEFHYVILADVLEHIPDGFRINTLKEIRRVLKRKGKLIITVPAYGFLYNAHDRFLHHFLRYSKKELLSELKQAGFKIKKVRYWNSILCPIIMIMKLYNKKYESQSDLKKIPRCINWLLYKILKTDERIELPFGITLLGVFEK